MTDVENTLDSRGKNNAGKSSVLDAVQGNWEDSIQITEDDFYPSDKISNRDHLSITRKIWKSSIQGHCEQYKRYDVWEKDLKTASFVSGRVPYVLYL